MAARRSGKYLDMMHSLSIAGRRTAPGLPPAWQGSRGWNTGCSEAEQGCLRERAAGGYAGLLGAQLAPPEAGARLDAPAGTDTAARLRAHLANRYSALHGRLARRLGCADLASDSLHNAWLRLERPVAGDVINDDAYVFRMACHLAVDQLREQTPWQSLDDPQSVGVELADEAPGPQQVAESRSALAALARAMDGLSRRQCAVLVALRVEGRSRDDVAAWLGLSTRTIDTALRQALRHCEQGLEWRAGAARQGRVGVDLLR